MATKAEVEAQLEAAQRENERLNLKLTAQKGAGGDTAAQPANAIPPDLEAEGYGFDEYLYLPSKGSDKPQYLRLKEVPDDQHGNTHKLKSLALTWEGSEKQFRLTFEKR